MLESEIVRSCLMLVSSCVYIYVVRADCVCVCVCCGRDDCMYRPTCSRCFYIHTRERVKAKPIDCNPGPPRTTALVFHIAMRFMARVDDRTHSSTAATVGFRTANKLG